MIRLISRIAALLLVVLLLVCTGALAEENGSLRHQVTGDISQLEVDEQSGLSSAKTDGVQASVGTDLYLFVDPDSASYITFYVTDEEGNPIEGALIYISYNGITELYGVTGPDGKCSMYLFRNVEYGYKVTKAGYEPAHGSFIATEETKVIHVVLRKLYTLTVYVLEDGVELPGTTVYIEGKEYVTDSEGKVQVRVPKGEYSIVAVAPDDGRRIPVQTVVSGDTVVIIEIGKNEDGTRESDWFLVYNKLYEPEDYVLTYIERAAENIAQAEGETDAEYAARTQRYLSENPPTVLVEAQPERVQNASGPDTDILKENGEPLYAQRSLMPTGHLLRLWEEQGYKELVFTNEDMGIRLDMLQLHSGDMAKAFALAQALNAREEIETIVGAQVLETEDGLELAGLSKIDKDEINLTQIDLNAIRAFEFGFDHDAEAGDVTGREEHELIDNTLYTNALFEFRITPVLPEALEDMIKNGLLDKPAIVMDRIMLASRGYFEEELRRWQADGKLTDTECSELFAIAVDGVLSEEEMLKLRKLTRAGELSSDTIKLLLQGAADEKVYRVSCWVILDPIQMNVTSLLKDMQVLWDADEEYGEECAEAEKANIPAEMIDSIAMAALEDEYGFATVDNQGPDLTSREYSAGMITTEIEAHAARALPLEDEEFFDVLSEKTYAQIYADVRAELIMLSGDEQRCFVINRSGATTKMEQSRYFCADSCTSGLVWLRPAGE